MSNCASSFVIFIWESYLPFEFVSLFKQIQVYLLLDIFSVLPLSFLVFVLVELGFEVRASYLLGRHYII
jgi:hypothetical protein